MNGATWKVRRMALELRKSRSSIYQSGRFRSRRSERVWEMPKADTTKQSSLELEEEDEP
jgi:hypothetical protein